MMLLLVPANTHRDRTLGVWWLAFQHSRAVRAATVPLAGSWTSQDAPQVADASHDSSHIGAAHAEAIRDREQALAEFVLPDDLAVIAER